MRRVYFIRHGQPDFPDGKRLCLGGTDLPLSPLGRLQGVLLGEALGGNGLAVFSSPLTRAADTARFLSPEPVLLPGLRELDMGAWDGLDFDTIREKWPALYAARGEDPFLPMPGAEPYEEGQRRFARAVDEALAKSRGDVALVSHTGVIQAFLSLVTGARDREEFRHRLPCGGWLLMEEETGRFAPLPPPVRPEIALTDALCLRLLRQAAPENVVAHCRAAAREAERIAEALCRAGLSLDRARVRHAALLHDIARTEAEHPAVGAAWLRELGWPELAELVRQHHDLESEELSEAAVVYIADKCAGSEGPVPLAARFAKSREKCRAPEALEAHDRRMRQALRVAAAINERCGQEVIL